jgi:hypothetical protein
MSAVRSFIASLVLLGTSCSEDVTCPAFLGYAVVAQVTSAGSGSPIIAARGEIRDGAHRDSLAPNGDGSYTAGGRAGTYTVAVESEAHLPWDTTGVRVTDTGGGCPFVNTAEIAVRLTPAQ